MSRSTVSLYIRIFLLFVACKIMLSCHVQKNLSTNAVHPAMVTEGPLWGAVWHQKAAEYKALCFQAYNIARLRLDILLQQSHSKPLAIVTDIDETVLDNSPYTVHRSLRDSGYSDASWITWSTQVNCDTVPGAPSFFKYAQSKGVHIYYITNRQEAERDATLKNLQQYNFPDAVTDHLLLKKETSGKEIRRQSVAQTHEIVLLLGDNLSDFSQVFDKKPFAERDARVKDNALLFGDRFIVLPNAIYGDWEPALYNFKYQLSPAQKDSIIKQQLRTY
jgi:5'-nucleotidase (lipoprotein e(P4) family)